MPSILPRRPERLPMTSPMYCSGVSTSTAMTGSSRIGSDFLRASLIAMEPAILKAASEESTSW